jgi:hypothetical protein
VPKVQMLYIYMATTHVPSCFCGAVRIGACYVSSGSALDRIELIFKLTWASMWGLHVGLL